MEQKINGFEKIGIKEWQKKFNCFINFHDGTDIVK